MGLVIKEGIKSSVASYIGVALGFVSFLVLFPLLLSKQEIGLVRTLEESTSLLATLALAGAPNLGIRYFPYFKNEENGNNGFLWILLVMPLFGIVVVAFGLWLFDAPLRATFSEPLMQQYWHYILPITIATMYFIVLDVYCRSNFALLVPTFLRDAAKRMVIILAGLAVWYKFMDFGGLMQWFGFSHLVILVLLVLYMWQKGLLQLQASPREMLTPSLRREMLDFSGFILLGNLGGLLLGKIDTLMIAAMVGLAETGVYGMAAKLILLIDLPRVAVQSLVMPLITKAYKEENIAEIQSLYQKTALNLLIVGAVLLLFLWCNADAIFAIIPNGEAFKAGKIVILYLGLAKVIDMACGVNYEILAFSKYYRISALLNFGITAATIFINYFFIKHYGFVGGGISTILIVIIFNMARGGFLYKKMQLQPFHKNALFVILITILIGIIEHFLPHFTQNRVYALADAIFHTILIGVVFLSLIIKFELSEDITNSFSKNIKRFLK